MKGYNEYLGDTARAAQAYHALVADLTNLIARADAHREYPLYPSELRELLEKHAPSTYRDQGDSETAGAGT